MPMETILFTPASLIDLLSKIDELSDYEINITESIDGELQLTIGESTYIISNDNVTDISVDEDVVEQIEDVNVETYEDLAQDLDVSYSDDVPIESGFFGELAKDIAIGGLVRFGYNLIKGKK